MLNVKIRVTYENDEGYTKISPTMTFRFPINKLHLYDDCVTVFNMETGEYLSYPKDRVVYLNIEREWLMNIRYRNVIYKSMLFNERVKSWSINDYDKEDVVISVFTYNGNKLILHLSYGADFTIKEFIELMEKEIERGDK